MLAVHTYCIIAALRELQIISPLQSDIPICRRSDHHVAIFAKRYKVDGSFVPFVFWYERLCVFTWTSMCVYIWYVCLCAYIDVHAKL